MSPLKHLVEAGYNCLCPGCQKRWNDGRDKGAKVDIVRCDEPKCQKGRDRGLAAEVRKCFDRSVPEGYSRK